MEALGKEGLAMDLFTASVLLLAVGSLRFGGGSMPSNDELESAGLHGGYVPPSPSFSLLE